MASLRETMTEAFKAMMAERKKEVPVVVEESTLSTEASDSAKSLKLEVAVDNSKTMKFVPENGDDNDEDADSDDPDMMPTSVVKDADKKSGPEKDRKNEKTLLDSVKSSATVVADETVKGSKSPSPNSEKTDRVKSNEKSTDTVDLARESESVDATMKKEAGSRIVKAGDRHLITKAVPTQTKQTEDQEELQTSKKAKSTETETPTTKKEAVTSKSVTETKKSDPKESVVKKMKEITETADNEKVTMQKERTKTNAAEESEKSKKKSTAKRGENDEGESELAKAVRAALLGEKRRVGKPKPPSRPPPWGNYNPYAARPSWPEHPPGAPTAYPYAPQPPHYGMPPPSGPPGGGSFSSTPPPPFGHQPPHSQHPGAPLPMMTHMELYASTFFPGYPPHVQQLLARQASRAMGLRSQYTEVIHRDDPPLSGPPPPLPYPPHAHMGPGGYPPPHPPPIGHGPPPHRDPRAHGPLPPRGPPPPGYMPNPHGHHLPPPHSRDMYGPPPSHPMARPSRDMPSFRRFGKKPMRAPMSFRDEDAELRFVMSRLAPPNKNPMRMSSDDHHHPLLSPNAPEFTPHQTASTGRGGGDRAAKLAGRPSMADLPPPEKRPGGRPQGSHKSATADAGDRKFLSPAQTSVFTQSGKTQAKDNKAAGKGNSLSPTSPEFVPNPKVQGHDLSKANAVQTAMKIAQERRASHDNQFPQEPMKRDLHTPVHEKLSHKQPQRAQPYDHPPKNPSKIARGPPSSRGNGGVPHFTEVHRSMDAMSPYMPPPGFGGHLRGGHRVTPDMSRYCSPSLRSLTVKENRELGRFKTPLSFDKRYRSGDRYGNWRSGPRMMNDHGAEHIQEVIDARQMIRQGPSLRDITNTASSPDLPPLPPLGGGGKGDAGANMKSSVLAPHDNEDMISRFGTASPPFMRKNPVSYLEAVSNNNSRFGGPAHLPKETSDGPDQQDIIALAEQSISRVQKENIPPPNDPTLGHPPLAQDRRRVTYKETRPTLRDLSRKARARHERSPENVHNHMPSDNVFVRTNGPQPLPIREVQNVPLHSPPGLPIPPHARRSSVTQTCDNTRPQAQAPATRESENRAQESRGLDSTEIERKDGGKQGRHMLPRAAAAAPERGGLPEMSVPPPHLAERDRRASLRETYKQAQHHQHFTPRSREIRIRDRIALAEQERREAALRDEREHHSPRSMQDVREREGDRFPRDENRGRSQEPDVSDLCEQYAIRNECRYGVDTCRYEHVKACDLTDAELDALYERRRERKAQRKRELEKYRYSDRDRYDSQREARSRRSRSPSYDDDDRRGPSRRSMRSPPRARRYNDRDHRRSDRRSGGDDTDATPGRIRATAYPMPASSGNRSNRRSRSRSNRRDRDRGGSSRPNGRSLHVRGTARPQRDQRDERERDYDRVKRDQRDRSTKDRDFSRARDLASKSVDNKNKENKDQKENKLSENAEDGELKAKKEKREPSREGALTDIRLAPRENRDEVCRFYGTDKPCWAGERCPFKHLGKDGKLLPTLNGAMKREIEKLEKLDGARDKAKKDTQDDPEKERTPVARALPPAVLTDLSTPKQDSKAQGTSAVNNAPPKASASGIDIAKESKKSISCSQK